MITAQLLMRPGLYRVLFAMGGVSVIDARPEGERLIRTTLQLSESMLDFIRSRDGIVSIGIVNTPPAPESDG